MIARECRECKLSLAIDVCGRGKKGCVSCPAVDEARENKKKKVLEKKRQGLAKRQAYLLCTE